MKEQTEQNKEKLLLTAEELILQRGLIATSVTDICSAANVSKGCFFHHFQDKDELAAKVIERFAAKMGLLFTKGPFQQEQSALKKLFGFFDYFSELVKNPMITRGCIVGIIGQEMGFAHPEYQQMTREAFRPGLQWVIGLLEAARQEQAPKQDFNSEELANYWLSLMQGSLVVIRSTGQTEIMHINAVHFRNFLANFW